MRIPRKAQFVLLCIILLTLMALAGPAPAAADSVEWRVDLNLAFTPDQVTQSGGANGLAQFRDGLSARLASENVGFHPSALVQSDSGLKWDLSLGATSDLKQFKQVVFNDLRTIGGLLGGPASLSLTGAIRKGESVSLILESNLATGYTWNIEQLDSSAVQVSEPSYSPKTNLVGAPSRQKLILSGLKDGTTSVVLSYRRVWEKAASPTRRVSIQSSQLTAIADLSNPVLAPRPPDPPTSLRSLAEPASPLPAIFDWRSMGVTPAVRDQGSCGSCWAFATVGVLEENILLRDHLSVNLSEQYLISCNVLGWGCEGGWWAHDMHEWQKPESESQAGAVLESSIPYAAQDAACNGPYDHPYRIDNWSYVGNQLGIPPADSIKQAIYAYGPVGAAVCVGPQFQNYMGGIFSTDESSVCTGFVNHAIVLVGWNDTNGTWILRNSWGDKWGESGYMEIKRDISNVGYAANYVIYDGMTRVQNWLDLFLPLISSR